MTRAPFAALVLVATVAACRGGAPTTAVDAAVDIAAADSVGGADDDGAPICPADPPPQARLDFPISGDGCMPGLDCGILPNGPSLNGTNVVNGADPTVSTPVEAVAYAGMVGADGSTADVATLVKGELVAKAGGADVPIAGLVMQGVRTTATGKVPVRLRISDAMKQGELTTYAVAYESAVERPAGCPGGPRPAEWAPLCTKQEGGATVPVRAVFVDAVWSYGSGVDGGGTRTASTTEFTVACVETSAIAKCLQAGYLPWAPRPDCDAAAPTCTLAAHHQACVRAVRADFCNNGFPLTDAGVPIRVYDTLPINPKGADTKGEASWFEEGALCISETRLTSLVGTKGTTRPFNVREYIDRVCPGKFTATGHKIWGGACRTQMLPDNDQVFTEFMPAMP